MPAMLQRPPVLRMSVNSLLLVCVALLLVHALAGHTHADLLAPVSMADHVPGDEHHNAAGGSCEVVRAPASGADMVIATSAMAVGAVLMAPTAFPDLAIADCRTPRSLPLFLLHAALLI